MRRTTLWFTVPFLCVGFMSAGFAQNNDPKPYLKPLSDFVQKKQREIDSPGEGLQAMMNSQSALAAIVGQLEAHLAKNLEWDPAQCTVEYASEKWLKYEGKQSGFDAWLASDQVTTQYLDHATELMIPYSVASSVDVEKAVGSNERGTLTIRGFDDYKQLIREQTKVVESKGMEPKIEFELGNLTVWSKSVAELEQFFFQEMKFTKQQIKYTGSLQSAPKGVGSISGETTVDPMLRAKIRVQYAKVTCAKRPKPRPERKLTPEQLSGADMIQMHWDGAFGPNGETRSVVFKMGPEASSVFRTLSEPNERGQVPITQGVIQAVKEIETHPEIIKRKLDIEEVTGCGLTLDIEIRVWEGELYRKDAYMTHVGIGTNFQIQGYNDSTSTPIRINFAMDPERIRDIRPDSRGLSPLQDYLGKLDYIYNWVTERNLKCERATTGALRGIVQ